ncbi:MAG: histidine kinase [Cytophagaceae bacterium]|jgi:signal transduction histidine kinase|nr:histidine kinase [Cytophagaceae bacterium]
MKLNLNISQKKHFYLISVFSLMILSASVALALITIYQTNQSITSLDHSYNINLKIERILSYTKDAETGERGYIITRSVEFLEPYQRAKENIDKELSELYVAFENDIEQRKNLDSLKFNIHYQLNLLSSVQSSFEKSNNKLTDSIGVFVYRGRAVMNQIRDKANQIKDVEFRRLQINKAETYQKSRFSIGVIVLTCSLSLLILLCVLILLNSAFHKKVEVEKNLISSQQLLEHQVHRLNLSNKELEQFAYVASHDLQEPLRKIMAFSERIGSKLINEKNEEILNYLERLNRSAARMRTLIQDLLMYSRSTRVLDANEKIDFNELFKIIIEDMDATIVSEKAKITLAKLPTNKGNKTQLRQLFQNLISNSLKFHKQGNIPKIEIWAEWNSASKIAEKNWAKDFNLNYPNYLCVFVKDNGIGFEAHYMQQIFVIFQRLHARVEYEGTGIGLAICKKIVENHEGFITAESVPDDHTTFIVGLPQKS